MSYRISYLVPKKEFKCLIEKKTVRSSTGSTHQKIVHSQKESETKESIKKWERTRKVKSLDREASETVRCEEKMQST